jgi:hypothetical protein
MGAHGCEGAKRRKRFFQNSNGQTVENVKRYFQPTGYRYSPEALLVGLLSENPKP